MSIEELIKKSDYKNILKYFKEISDIPRGSGNNKGISNYLIEFAKSRGFKAVQDEALNVIIYKDASEGYEDMPTVIIQGHMDMVCVKKDGCSHDFIKDGIKLLVNDDYIKADGTTLGADDGIALAYGLALLDDNKISHPALEFLFTTDEETGMDGARAIDISRLSGRMIINIDSENETTALIGCAGGLTIEGRLPIEYILVNESSYTIKISGLKGGHSGAEIDKGRTNAVLLMARLLMDLNKSVGFDLVTIKGGEKDNAIPSLCEAIIIPDETLSSNGKFNEKIIKEVNRLIGIYKYELALSEPDLKTDISKSSKKAEHKAFSKHSFDKLILLLNLSPNGVQVMSPYINGLVESSLNLGRCDTNEMEVILRYSIRSSMLSYKYFIRDKIISLFNMIGGHTKEGSEYPAWEYKKESKLRDHFSNIYYKEYGKNPRFEAIHAGLECGIINEKIPDADIISIGPDMLDIHTPEERLSITSSIRLYKFIEKLLGNIKLLNNDKSE